MFSVGPGETITIAQSGIPTGQTVGYQVMKAASGSISIARTTVGVVERPAGSGNYIATFVAPPEPDLYLIVIDWNNGVINTSTSKVEELLVTSTVAQDETGLGPVADYTKTFLGGETFQMLLDSVNYGPGYISTAIGIVKARVSTVTIDLAGESLLPIIVLSYLGKLSALQLIPAAIDIWATQAQSKSMGNDPAEIVTYASRDAMLRMLQENLLRLARADEALALALLPEARLLSTESGPAIDEEELAKVTSDPRRFPRAGDFPYRDPFAVASLDPYRYGP